MSFYSYLQNAVLSGGRFGWQFTQTRAQGRDASPQKPSSAPNP